MKNVGMGDKLCYYMVKAMIQWDFLGKYNT